jgi:hypothetical protein
LLRRDNAVVVRIWQNSWLRLNVLGMHEHIPT